MPRPTLATAVLAGCLTLGAATAGAQSLTPVPGANPRAPGVVAPNVLSVELEQVIRARNALDSMYLFDVRTDYSNPASQPVRILAQGRDASATIDASSAVSLGNEGDNEITGIHVSDGDPTVNGVLGNKHPTPFVGKWRVFYKQQHGDLTTWEIIPNPGVAEAVKGGPHDDDDEDDD